MSNVMARAAWGFFFAATLFRPTSALPQAPCVAPYPYYVSTPAVDAISQSAAISFGRILDASNGGCQGDPATPSYATRVAAFGAWYGFEPNSPGFQVNANSPTYLHSWPNSPTSPAYPNPNYSGGTPFPFENDGWNYWGLYDDPNPANPFFLVFPAAIPVPPFNSVAPRNEIRHGQFQSYLLWNQWNKAVPATGYVRPEAGTLNLTKLYSSGWLISTHEFTIAIDVVEPPCDTSTTGMSHYPIQKYQLDAVAYSCDALFISHQHLDHCSMQLAHQFIRNKKLVICPPAVRQILMDFSVTGAIPSCDPVHAQEMVTLNTFNTYVMSPVATIGGTSVFNGVTGATISIGLGYQASSSVPNYCFNIHASVGDAKEFDVLHLGDETNSAFVETTFLPSIVSPWSYSFVLNMGGSLTTRQKVNAWVTGTAPNGPTSSSIVERFISHDHEVAHPDAASHGILRYDALNPHHAAVVSGLLAERLIFWGEAFKWTP